MKKTQSIILLLSLTTSAIAQQMPTLEVYGNLPTISQMAVSPSGNRIAYRNITNDMDAVVVQDLALGKFLGGTDVSKVNPRDVYFIDEDRLVLVVAEAWRTAARRRVVEASVAILYDVNTGESRQLLRRALEKANTPVKFVELKGEHLPAN